MDAKLIERLARKAYGVGDGDFAFTSPGDGLHRFAALVAAECASAADDTIDLDLFQTDRSEGAHARSVQVVVEAIRAKFPPPPPV